MHSRLSNVMTRRAVLTACAFAAPVLSADWPVWRGPGHAGVAAGSAPLEWSEGKNIAWKANVPGRGFSSPIVVGGRVFVTTAVSLGDAKPSAPPEAPPEPRGPGGPGGKGGFGKGKRGPGGGLTGGDLSEHRFVVMCLDRKSGKLLWEKTAAQARPHEGHHPRYGSFASNSPISDGKRVFAVFGSRGLYAYDLNGKELWKKDFNIKMSMFRAFGEGVAPALHGKSLIVSYLNESGSFITVLDTATGNERWRATPEESTSWAMPLIVEHGGRAQVVFAATGKVRSYDLADGKLIWEAAGLGRNVIPAPVHDKGIVYVMSGYVNPKLMAIKLGKEGDLTGTDSIVWTMDRGLSYTASPVLHEGKLYFITDSGMMTAVDAATGKPFYQQQRLPKPYNFKASPVLVGGRIYLASEEGDVIVIKAGEAFEVLATNTIADESFVSSPAVADGSMYLRGRNTLYCVRD